MPQSDRLERCLSLALSVPESLGCCSNIPVQLPLTVALLGVIMTPHYSVVAWSRHGGSRRGPAPLTFPAHRAMRNAQCAMLKQLNQRVAVPCCSGSSVTATPRAQGPGQHHDSDPGCASRREGAASQCSELAAFPEVGFIANARKRGVTSAASGSESESS